MTFGTADLKFDVIIVGSGPAGVSAAFPLVQAGLKVLMVDGGGIAGEAAPSGRFNDNRRHDLNQWKWMVGEDFYALRNINKSSPKLRVPNFSEVFEGFAEHNHIKAADGFVALGSLARGGLSNAWGGGVAAFSDEELRSFPIDIRDLRLSYKLVAQRIGISGNLNDDLSNFFLLDEVSQPPIQIDRLQGSILERYMKHRDSMSAKGFRVGRSRVAVLSEPMGDRKACDLLGNCLYGCERRAIYSATDDLKSLIKYDTFSYRSGFLVQRVRNQNDSIIIEGRDGSGFEVIRGKRLLLAAGTLASTRLALEAINHRSPISMQSCPTAAFMLWLPRHLGSIKESAFGLGQLSFLLTLAGGAQQCFGSLFNTGAIPVSEFLRQIPFGRRYGIDLLEPLLRSCAVGNVFLPGSMTSTSLRLDFNNALVINGHYVDQVPILLREAENKLRYFFWKLGAILLPESFTLGSPGADIHYAASLPMNENPKPGQTDGYGELACAGNIYVVDGASLSCLPIKSHTLTIMANADRIARHLVEKIFSKN
jgi:hypothetical protein